MPSNDTKISFMPVRSNIHDWHAHCPESAMAIFRKNEHPKKLREQPGKPYLINALPKGGIWIPFNSLLWQTVDVIHADYPVDILPPGAAEGAFVPWTGAPSNEIYFQVIRIQNRTAP